MKYRVIGVIERRVLITAMLIVSNLVVACGNTVESPFDMDMGAGTNRDANCGPHCGKVTSDGICIGCVDTCTGNAC